MSGFITLEAAKKSFFDRDKVKKAVDRPARSILSRLGAFVRTTSTQSIKEDKESAPAGQPPHSHTKARRKALQKAGLTAKAAKAAVPGLKEGIFFSYDPARKSVVIGPVLWRPDSKVPELTEFGGKGSRVEEDGKAHPVTYQPHPFMRPALQKELPKFPQLWAHSVR